MDVFNINVENLQKCADTNRIVEELRTNFAVKGVNIDTENSVVRIIMDDYGSVRSCLSILGRLGYPERNVRIKAKNNVKNEFAEA